VFCRVTVERGWSQTSRSAHFLSIALRANNALRLGFATAALR
jgi:hypothetical protein